MLNRPSFPIGTVKVRRKERGAGRGKLTFEGRGENVGGLNRGDSFFYIYNFIYLFLAVLNLHCCTGFSQIVASGGCCLVVVCWLLLLQITGSRGRGLQ